MPAEIQLSVAFGLGLASSLHCLGMCGAVISAFALSVAPPLRARTGTLLMFTITASAGRIAGYALAGALMSSIGVALVGTAGATAHAVLQCLAWLMVVAMAVQLAGLRTPLAPVERAAARLWSGVAPRARALLPIRNAWQAFAFGLLWGYLPCGLVYAALLWVAGAGSVLTGAGAMAMFGLGTLPSVVGAGLFGARLAGIARRPALRAGAAFGLVLLATVGLWQSLSGQHHAHAGHGMPTAADPMPP